MTTLAEILAFGRVEQKDGCWFWQAGEDKNGYGLMRVDGKTQRIHRVVYTLTKGEIPNGLHVLHSCDQPGCVNPEHLYLGTHQRNMTDMVEKGRSHKPIGSKNGRAKLTWEKVCEIRAACAAGEHPATVGKRYDTPRGTIYNIIAGRSWQNP